MPKSNPTHRGVQVTVLGATVTVHGLKFNTREAANTYIDQLYPKPLVNIILDQLLRYPPKIADTGGGNCVVPLYADNVMIATLGCAQGESPDVDIMCKDFKLRFKYRSRDQLQGIVCHLNADFPKYGKELAILFSTLRTTRPLVSKPKEKEV